MGDLLEKVLKRFEQTIIITLMALLAMMVALGTFSLIELMVSRLPHHMSQVTDVVTLQEAMQRGFGGLLVVLIGLELMDTLKHYWAGQHVRVEIVFLVGLIALGRRAPAGEDVDQRLVRPQVGPLHPRCLGPHQRRLGSREPPELHICADQLAPRAALVGIRPHRALEERGGFIEATLLRRPRA